MVLGLKRLPETKLRELPRMADFALLIAACEEGLWDKGTFIRAYTGNIDEATQSLIEGDIVAAAIMEIMSSVATEWVGSSKDLLGALDRLVGESGARRREWPKSPKALSGHLTRLAPSFRRIGLEIKRLPREQSMRPIRLEWVGEKLSSASCSSGMAEIRRSHMTFNDGRNDDLDRQSSSEKPLKPNGNDELDDHDGQIHPQSGNDPWADLRDQRYGLQPPKGGQR
jgi:hypothetical protein